MVVVCPPHSDWEEDKGPRFNFSGENALEGFEDFEVWETNPYYSPVAYMASLMLVKIRLLGELESLRNVAIIARKVPQEILDLVREQLAGPLAKSRKEIMGVESYAPFIERLKDQIAQLYYKIHMMNGEFWRAMLNRGCYLTLKPDNIHDIILIFGGRKEIDWLLICCYQSWEETPGALAMIETFARRVQ